MKDFRALNVWEKAHVVVLAAYRATRSFPGEERFGLTSQIRRSAVSIPSNIAEGCGRGSDADFARFIQYAVGSSSELEYQILLARDLGYMNDVACEALSDRLVEVRRMLIALLKTLRS
jgi:four helix bundle protein